jgi:hypothetical protein
MVKNVNVGDRGACVRGHGVVVQCHFAVAMPYRTSITN